MVERLLKTFHQLLQKVFLEVASVDIQLLNGHILLNEEVINDRVARMPGQLWLSKICFERKISRLTFERATTVKDLQHLALVLNQLPHQFASPADGPRMLEQSKVDNISFNERKQAIKEVSRANPLTEPKSLDKTRQFEFQLPLEEKSSLVKELRKRIQNRQLNLVAETLNLITQDLNSKDRELVELALPSYRIVIEILIETKQDRPLHQVLRSMGQELKDLAALDVFGFHLRTFSQVLIYCRQHKHSGAVAFGLNTLAVLARHDNPIKQDLAKEQIALAFDEECMSLVIDNQDRNTPHKAHFNKLLSAYGALFLQPMLNALYASSDRHVRRGLMSVLQSMGPVIYPDLTDDLVKAFGEDQPWYVKRNLLRLLYESPPATLIPVLETNLHDAHPKVRELVHRCILNISDQDAFRLGKSLIMSGSDDQRVQAISYLAANGVSAYAPVLCELVEGETSEAIKRAAIKALARLDSKQGNEFLAGLLGSGASLMNKLHNSLRVLTAEALLQARNSKAKAILSRHLNDKDKQVKLIASRVLMPASKTL